VSRGGQICRYDVQDPQARKAYQARARTGSASGRGVAGSAASPRRSSSMAVAKRVPTKNAVIKVRTASEYACAETKNSTMFATTTPNSTARVSCDEPGTSG